MTEIKPGDKFNIRHETHSSGEGVWSGPYECVGLWTYDGLNIIYIDHSKQSIVDASKCVKVESENYE